VLSAGLVFALCVCGVGVAFAASTTFHLTLRGLDAVPRADRGDSAKAVITIDTQTRTICWRFTNVQGLGSLARPRIGKAPTGKGGSIVVTLAKRLQAKGCSTEPRRTLTDILKQPGAYYIVLTNQDHPHGAMRAQL